MLKTLLLSTLLGSSLMACSQDSFEGDCSGGQCDTDQDLQFCAAIRGNGQLISAHFGALARLVESYGPIDAAAGGSSASVTIFLTESMQRNPAIYACGDRDCNASETKARLALLLKSFPGYIKQIGANLEANFANFAPLRDKFLQSDIQNLLNNGDGQAGVEALRDMLRSNWMQGNLSLINPEMLGMLADIRSPEVHRQHAQDFMNDLQSLGAFSADSDTILIHPGLLRFSALAEHIGESADFYAGYGPRNEEGMNAFLTACALPSLGQDWFQSAQIIVDDTTCGAMFNQLVDTFRAAYRDTDFLKRLDEKVGAGMPSLISTSLVSGESAASLKQAQRNYREGRPYNFVSNFNDVSFGYWGRESDVTRVAKNENGFLDLKTQKYRSLGEATWAKALRYSPAEPGLSKAEPLGDGSFSAGGWSDLHPVLALKNLGCQNVVYVTRQGNESSFAMGVAKLLGMGASSQTDLYGLDSVNPFADEEVTSSFEDSLQAAEATYCTNWDAYDGLDLQGITQNAYNAPMDIQGDFFGAPRETGLRGCTFGASEF